MPKVVGFTPKWISRPSPGFDMFTPSSNAQSRPTQAGGHVCSGPRRTIAKRDTEVFIVAGNTIRWADLTLVKDDFEGAEERNRTPSKRRGKPQVQEEDSIEGKEYKTLKIDGIHEQIQQLVISPNGDFMAIVTAHTVRIAILPDSIHLTQADPGPIKVKTSTLGPTTHVVSQSRVVDALWHPLGTKGQCLVTVTADAVVRLWELSKDNRWSYDRPTVDIDVAKLLHAESMEDKVASARIGDNKGYSLDHLGMEVASAAFGGKGSDSEQGWSSMTLWVAMTEGDVYALCPLLPSKWKSPSTQVPSLTTAVLAKKSYAEGPESHEELQRNVEAQIKWLADLDSQEPIINEADGTSEYRRPTAIGPLPKLQGPFRILPGDLEDDLELSDVHVVAPKLNVDDLMEAEDEDHFEESDPNGLSATMICLMTSTGRVYICLNLEEVEGQWLPAKKPKVKLVRDPDAQPELILLEGLDTSRQSEGSQLQYPVFTEDTRSRYSFFVTHSEGVIFFSLEPWVQILEAEIQREDTAGASFRMTIHANTSGTLRERITHFEVPRGSDPALKATAPVIFNDSDLGYFLLTCLDETPKGFQLELPHDEPSSEYDDIDSDLDAIEYHKDIEEWRTNEGPDVREPFEPPAIFWNHRTALSTFLEKHVNQRHRSMLKDEIRLSSATLEVITEAHRVLSHETYKMGDAVSRIFVRCRLLQVELQAQVKKVKDMSSKVDKIIGDDADDYGESQTPRGTAKLLERLGNTQQRQSKLIERYDTIRKKLSQASARPLSEREKEWIAQVDRMRASLMLQEGEEPSGKKKEYWQRAEEARELGNEFIAEAKEIAAQANEAAEDDKGIGFKVPSDVRKSKMKKVMELLERESALVDAAEERLQRLSIVGA